MLTTILCCTPNLCFGLQTARPGSARVSAGKSSSGRDGAKARERKRAMQEGMAASTTKTGKAKKDKVDGLDWGKIKSN